MTKPPNTIEVSFGEKAYSFHLYVSADGIARDGTKKGTHRYVALSNTVGCGDVFGEGWGWWNAVSNCMGKILKINP